MGFLKGFPKHLVGDVSAGTGLSGILATMTLFLAEMFKLPKWQLMLIEVPTVIIYYKAFTWLVYQKKTQPFDRRAEQAENKENVSHSDIKQLLNDSVISD